MKNVKKRDKKMKNVKNVFISTTNRESNKMDQGCDTHQESTRRV